MHLSMQTASLQKCSGRGAPLGEPSWVVTIDRSEEPLPISLASAADRASQVLVAYARRPCKRMVIARRVMRSISQFVEFAVTRW